MKTLTTEELKQILDGHRTKMGDTLFLIVEDEKDYKFIKQLKDTLRRTVVMCLKEK